MSVWTHVNGVVRLNDYSFLSSKRNTRKDVEKIIGPMCLFHNWNENTKLPLGSEGSIEYKVIQSTEESNLARFNIIFWGDLRDYDDLNEIIQWFNNLKKEIESKDTFMQYRDAILSCECEAGNSIIVKLNTDTNKLEVI